MEPRFAGKVFLVTGGTSGMGRETVKRLAEEGAAVVAMGRSVERLKLWQEEPRVVTFAGDVTSLEDIERVIAVIRTQFGRLDGLCNAAGLNDLCYPLLETEDARWDLVLDTDLKAPFRLARAALPLMIESGGGSIVNIGSYAGIRGNHGPSYSAAKAGLIGLTRSIAFAYGKDNIRCNIINPGGCNTNIGQTSGGTYHPAIVGLSNLIKNMPIRSYGQPEEVAAVCAFLFSDDARWINGAVIAVDGGMSVC